MSGRHVPTIVKNLSWDKWIGDSVAKSTCLCCGINTIKMYNFYCGHIISKGLSSVNNVKPICADCFCSIGNTDMEDFRFQCGFKVYDESSGEYIGNIDDNEGNEDNGDNEDNGSNGLISFNQKIINMNNEHRMDCELAAKNEHYRDRMGRWLDCDESKRRLD